MSETPKENGNETGPNESRAAVAEAQERAPASRAVILVDVSNVAYGKTSGVGGPQLDYVKRVLAHLSAFPVQVIALADASLRHKIDRPSDLEDMLNSGEVQQVPAGTSADEFLWQLWKRNATRGERAYILTNDKFPMTNSKNESLATNPRIAYLFSGKEFVLMPSIESLIVQGSGQPAVEEPKPATRPPKSNAAPSSPPMLTSTNEPEVGGPRIGNTEVPASDAQTWPGSGQQVLHVEEKQPMDSELVDVAVRIIAGYTEPPGGRVTRINFATVSHDLHSRYGGDFVSKFGLKRPKELATALVEDGLVSVSFKNQTMYVEPTDKLETLIVDRGLPRREKTTSSMATGREPPYPRELSPSVVEVSAGAPAPTVEISSPVAFQILVRDHKPKHIFHWNSKVRLDENEGIWKRASEFFFVEAGTAFRLGARGYESIEDFADGSTHGFEDADDPDKIGGGPELGEWRHSPGIWEEILHFSKLDERAWRPSEGDVFYCARAAGFTDFQDFVADRKAKPRATQVYR